ncbi:uncharacterized protein LOC135939025 isoform X2 [Cloeon dipterum]|uniref:uncharacterized protein LOC135939025 isoform X2 n=1 Tax=Cloeon dipterum TaxID=197152 RepID=UPI00321FDEB9
MGPDLMNNCRICLMENNIMIPIFGEDGAYRKIREMIRDSLNITVFQGDPLPRKICCKCYFKLQQACQLKADCQRTTKFYISNLNGQRSPDAIRAVKTLNHQLNILQGTAYISHAHHKDQEGAGPSRNLTSNQDHSQAIRATLTIDLRDSGTNSSAAHYICELCDKTFSEKHQIAIHKHAMHGLQLLIQVREPALLTPPSTEQDADATNAQIGNIVPPAPVVQPHGSEAQVVEDVDRNIAPTDDKDKDDDGGDAVAPPSPLAPSVEDMDVGENSSTNQVVIVDDEIDDIGVEDTEDAANAKSMETSNGRSDTNKQRLPAEDKERMKTQPMVVLAKLKGHSVEKPAPDKIKKVSDRKSSKLKREMRLLETNSSMRVDPDEIEIITSRKRTNSLSSNSHQVPSKMRKKLEKIKVEFMGSDEDEPSSMQMQRSCSSTITSTPKVTHQASRLSLSKKTKEPSLIGVEINDKDLQLVQGKLECVYCFSWIKMDDVDRYFRHMRTHHPQVQEDGWAVKPPESSNFNQMSPERENLNISAVNLQTTGPSSSGAAMNSSLQMMQCQFCDKTFKLLIQLKHHLDSEHDMKYCCDTAFSKDSYLDHKAQHELNGNGNTNRSLEEEDALDVMIDSKQKKAEEKEVKNTSSKGKDVLPKYPSKCVRCIYVGTEQALYKHYREFHNNYWCVGCKSIFPDLNALEDHFNSEHTMEYIWLFKSGDKEESNDMCICTICKLDCKVKEHLLKHYKMDHGKLACFICTKPFDTNNERNKHGKKCKERKCSVCQKKFPLSVQLVLHRLEHIHLGELEDTRENAMIADEKSNEGNQKVKKTEDQVGKGVDKTKDIKVEQVASRCDTCQVEFAGPRLLAQHVRKHHTPKREKKSKTQNKSKCKTCNREFMNATCMSFHECKKAEKGNQSSSKEAGIIKQSSTEENYISCGYCDLSFKSTQELQKHAESHLTM